MNDTLKTISERYSCREYLPRPLPDDALRCIAEAAVQSPSAMNRQPWRVIMVRDPALIAEMESEGMANLALLEDKTSYYRIIERGGKLFYGAPCVAVIAIDCSNSGISYIDCGIVCQTITLAAASLGIASVICGFAGLVFNGANGGYFEQKLGFPEGFKFGCSVLLGYAKTEKKPHKPDYGKFNFIG